MNPDRLSPGKLSRARRALGAALCTTLCVAGLGLFPVHAADTPAPLTLGLIVTGDTVEKMVENWKPFTDALAKDLQRPVRVLASKDFAEVSSALKSGQVQVAWINNKLAIELVETDQALVFAQMVGLDGTRGYSSVLLARKDGAPQTLAEVIARPGSYTLGAGNKESISGFLAPNYYVFAKNKIDPEKHFKKINRTSHRDNFLAVADGQVDLATNNTADMLRYQVEFPDKMTRVKVIWESPLIPNDPILYRKDLPAATQQRIRKFFLAYGRDEAEKATLKNMYDLSAFKASSNYQLRPVVDLALFQTLTKAMGNSQDGGDFSVVLQQLTKRAARLDTLLNSTRIESQ